MLVECLLILLVFILIYQRWMKRDIYELGYNLKWGIRTLPLLGHSYMFWNKEARMKALQTLGKDALKKNSGMTAVWHGTYLYTMIAEPEAAEFVLKNCLEKDDIMKMVTAFLGNGSIFAPVPIWKPRRRVLMPAFSTKNLKNFYSIIQKQSKVLIEQLDKVAGTGIFPAWKYYNAYTIDSIAEATLGFELHAQKDLNHPFLKAFDVGLRYSAERVVSPWLHNNMIYKKLPVYKELMDFKDYLWNFIQELLVIKRKEIKLTERKEQDNGSDKTASEERLHTFLELLIVLSGGDEGYTDVEIIEEMMVMLIAGSDTTAVGSSFVALMLSIYPEVQEKVYEELQEVFGDSDRQITWEDLPRLKYLEAVIKETLRVYTPVPIITRKVEKEVILPSGLKLVPETGVIVNIWALHRNQRYWGEDAELFRPERFIDTPLKHPAAFMPFSNGPRNCAGYQFGMASMKTATSSVLRHFKILPATTAVNGEYPPFRLKFDLMMKDADGFQIKLERRH